MVIIASRSTPVSSIAVIFGSLTFPFFARSSGLIVCGLSQHVVEICDVAAVRV